MKAREQYEQAFLQERKNEYPLIDAFEIEFGYACSRERLEDAARVLACPVKINPPNWQHGRVLYALARSLLEEEPHGGVLLDIGTAKGFSAVVMSWAVADARARCRVLSVDIVEPTQRVIRNSVAECAGELPTVHELVAPYLFPAFPAPQFYGGGSVPLLQQLLTAGTHVRFAFVDGKHNALTVREEARLLTDMQRPGDVLLFDDMQIASIAQVALHLSAYRITHRLRINSLREYAVAVRR